MDLGSNSLRKPHHLSKFANVSHLMAIVINNWYMGSTGMSSYGSAWEVLGTTESYYSSSQMLSKFPSTSITQWTMKQLFQNFDIILPNGTSPKCTDSLQVCVSMDSFHHKCALIRLWSKFQRCKQIAWLKLPDSAGYVTIRFDEGLTLETSAF